MSPALGTRDIPEQGAIPHMNSELERRVEQRTAELQEALKELEAFTYTVAHDLRAPLRAMHGFGQILLEDHAAGMDETAREYLRQIVESGDRMDVLITDLLTYSRLSRQEVPLERIELDLVADQVLHEMAAELEGCGAEVHVERPLPTAIGHGVTLSQSLSNLVSNAAKFVAPGVAPRITIRGESRGDKVRLWVEDNGIGIAPEYHGRLFKVFERLHGREEYSGTGIGLAIVRRAVERMHGRAGLESAPGRGSRFWIELPGDGETKAAASRIAAAQDR